MARIREHRSARRKLEEAVADLLAKAQAYQGSQEGWRTRELLYAAREYGRAFNRVETMRGR